jgi:transcriptional regulator of aromatic amino acid metabolism
MSTEYPNGRAEVAKEIFATLIFALATVPVVSLSAEWVHIGVVNSQFGSAKVELDVDSIRKSSGSKEIEVLRYEILHSKVRSGWFRVSFKPVVIKGQKMSSGLMRININCNTASVQTEAMIVYEGARGTGKRLASTESDSINLWTDIVPDSLQDLARHELCQYE